MLALRVTGRWIDPVTKQSYHVTFDPPPAGEVAVGLGRIVALYHQHKQIAQGLFKPWAKLANYRPLAATLGQNTKLSSNLGQPCGAHLAVQPHNTRR